MKLQLTLLLALLGTSALARADDEESPKVRKARLENDLEKEGESTDQACGTKLKVTIDWASFEADPTGWENKSVSGYCDAPFGALRRFCEGAKGKAYVKKAVTEVVCKAAKDKAGWKALRKGTVLEWHVSPDAVNNDAYAKTQLLKNF